MAIWYIILVTVMSDGRAMVDVKYPNTAEYNNEKTCNEVGNVFMEQEQTKLGTSNGTVYYICKNINEAEIKAALSKKGNGA